MSLEYQISSNLNPKKMKTKVLFLVVALSVFATSANSVNNEYANTTATYRNSNAITFVERGIKFYVFTNGNFDFNSRYRNNKYDAYNERRTNGNRGIRIVRDYNGKIRRVGNVFINYDYRGNVTRIGNIFMRYRRGKLVRIGNMNVRYDRWGDFYCNGNIRNNNPFGNPFYTDINLHFGPVYNYDNSLFYSNDFTRKYRKYREDKDYYYYKSKTANKNKEQIIRRKKNKESDTNRANTSRR
ncbi:hypothetical protein BSU00_12165 [Tenacibaculum sp. SG-28]|nr:hypothetical protein BSU00_12165 [Tenacibaculum sp. SG-28]